MKRYFLTKTERGTSVSTMSNSVCACRHSFREAGRHAETKKEREQAT